MSISEDEHESRLSAMFDNEASIEDLDALLAADPKWLQQKMQSYQLIQQSLQKDGQWQERPINLVDSVRSSLDSAESTGDDSLEVASTNAANDAVVTPLWRGWFTGMAVAASVAFVVILGGNQLLDTETQATHVVELDAPEQGQPDTAPVSIAELNSQPMPADNLRLKNYLREHAEQAAKTSGQGMIPMARVVSYPVAEK